MSRPQINDTKTIEIQARIKGRPLAEIINLIGERLREKAPGLMNLEPTKRSHCKTSWSDFYDGKMLKCLIEKGTIYLVYKIWRVTKRERWSCSDHQ